VLPKDPHAVIGNGSILHFQYNLASLDGLHTATLLPPTETPAQAWANHPLVVLDEPEPAPKPILNPNAIFQNPTGCGQSASNPCVYTGASEVNSGALPAFAGTDFFVKINLAKPKRTTVHYVCLIHPGMQGSIQVVKGRGPSPEDFAESGREQLEADTKGALAAEAAANTTQVTINSDGSRTITMTAGTATQFVEVAEMLPKNVTVHRGDRVNWVTTSQKDPHTVTFPDTGGGPSLVEPLSPPYAPPPECEGTPDTAPNTCSNFELPINPAPNGVTAITSTATVATSGVIAPFPPFPNNFTFSFPATGSFPYQCRIHDHMNGVITVSS
jgi:plastocyanin